MDDRHNLLRASIMSITNTDLDDLLDTLKLPPAFAAIENLDEKDESILQWNRNALTTLQALRGRVQADVKLSDDDVCSVIAKVAPLTGRDKWITRENQKLSAGEKQLCFVRCYD